MFSIEQFSKSEQLPSLPEIALKLVEIAQQDEPDYGEVSRIIRSDPVISGKILKTVNSALFGFRQSIETVEQAVPKLGITLLRTLVLSFYLGSEQNAPSEHSATLQNHWRCSLTQAVLAELIAEQVDGADAPTCFLGGMLQDIGILAFLSETPQEYMQHVLDRAHFPSVVSAESSYYGFSHVDVSRSILQRWGMETLSRVVAHHHDRVASPPKASHYQLAPILQAATLGAEVLFTTRDSAMKLGGAIDQWIGFLENHFGFSPSYAEEMISEVNQRVGEYSSLFSFQVGDGISTERVVQQAKTLLQEIALKNQLELVARQKSGKNIKLEDDPLYRDSLTGLFNRRYLNEHLNEQLAKSIKKRKPVAFLFLDVDKFKSINDTWGHKVGDQAIQHVGNWLTQATRAYDFAIRLGGDEFLVILQKLRESDFENIVRRIGGEIPPLELDDGEIIQISLSVGSTYYQPKSGDDPDTNWLIDQADKAMYEAKRNGGDSISIQKFVGTELVGTHA